MTINDLLNEAATQLGKVSDATLSKELGAYQSKLSNWRHGEGQPDLYAIWRLAEITGRDVMEIMAIIEAERDKRPEVKAFFEKVLETGAYKKVIAAGIGMGAMLSPFGSGDAAAAAMTHLSPAGLDGAAIAAGMAMFIMSS
ncbi:hypothetical protein [Chitinimonas koreensis]|uniref:hypothetical protein n=1 Tax=Chitinimonas koreensis TaxID=356302 RepID=UPI0012F9C6B4|nr:hypothetical protein [Chitinimonas koreensis]QNM98691.1 hypothetical protein H9L41_10975 [Chitinimonas koreensis]